MSYIKSHTFWTGIGIGIAVSAAVVTFVLSGPLL
jgi:hypothetical protein